MRIADRIDLYRTLRRRLGLPGAARYLLMKKYPRTLARAGGAVGYKKLSEIGRNAFCLKEVIAR